MTNVVTIFLVPIVAVPASGPNKTIEGLKTIVTTNRLVLNTFTTETISVGELKDESGVVFPMDTIMSSIVRLVHDSKAKILYSPTLLFRGISCWVCVVVLSSLFCRNSQWFLSKIPYKQDSLHPPYTF